MNPPPVVLKFGGTSVEDATAMRRVAEIAADRARHPGDAPPVLVVSAMAQVTDRLVALADLALAGDLDRATTVIDQLRTRHLDVLHDLVAANPHSQSFTQDHGADSAGASASETAAALSALFDQLHDLVRGIAAVGELTGRTRDAILSFGERLSPLLVRVALQSAGLRAQCVDARQIIVTDDQHTRAQPLYDDCQRQSNERLAPVLEAGVIPILGGFIAGTRQGVATTLGRGGSDFSAAIVGALLRARRIEIWTDVDGMLTADPRVCADVRRIKVISFQEAAELAYFGAKVLHPSTLLPAMHHGIPVWVLNSRRWLPGPPDGERTGTLITTRAPRAANPFKCISCKRKIAVVDVVSTRMLLAHGFLQAIWEVFARHRCSVDMVSTSEVSVSLTVSELESLPDIADELGHFADVRYEGRKAILCLVGESIRHTSGLAGQVFAALGDINVRMISQGASEINIGMVIDDDDVPRAMRLLHERFFTQLDRSIFA